MPLHLNCVEDIIKKTRNVTTKNIFKCSMLLGHYIANDQPCHLFVSASSTVQIIFKFQLSCVNWAEWIYMCLTISILNDYANKPITTAKPITMAKLIMLATLLLTDLVDQLAWLSRAKVFYTVFKIFESSRVRSKRIVWNTKSQDGSISWRIWKSWVRILDRSKTVRMLIWFSSAVVSNWFSSAVVSNWFSSAL